MLAEPVSSRSSSLSNPPNGSKWQDQHAQEGEDEHAMRSQSQGCNIRIGILRPVDDYCYGTAGLKPVEEKVQ